MAWHSEVPTTNNPDPDYRPFKRKKPEGDFALAEGALYEREKRFVNALLELLEGGEPLNDDTLIAAGRQAFRFGGLTDSSANQKALRQAREMMSNPNVVEKFTDLFANAGFSPADAAAMHVAHMREGNYQALRDYWKMITPVAPRQSEMKAAVLHMNAADYERSRLPATMAARQIGAAYEQVESGQAVVEYVQTEVESFVTDERAAVEESASEGLSP